MKVVNELVDSWCNTRPWRLHITEGAATERLRAQLLAHVQAHPPAPDFAFPARYTGVYRRRRRECGRQLYGSLGIVQADRERTLRQLLRNFELFDAPHVAIITTEADLGVYGAIDCGLYINTFLLAAQSLGLAAAPQAALASCADFLHDHPVNSFRTTRDRSEDAVTWHAG